MVPDKRWQALKTKDCCARWRKACDRSRDCLGADQLFGEIQSGWNAAHDSLLDATAQSALLEASPSLNNSIRLRLPYIEPLNHLQIELMKRHRAGEVDPRIAEGIQLTINAVATALRNSG